MKFWSTPDALRDCAPMVGLNTAVVSFQNGVIAADEIAKVYGRPRTLGGVANIAAIIERPGVIRHTGTMASLQWESWTEEYPPRFEPSSMPA